MRKDSQEEVAGTPKSHSEDDAQQAQTFFYLSTTPAGGGRYDWWVPTLPFFLNRLMLHDMHIEKKPKGVFGEFYVLSEPFIP